MAGTHYDTLGVRRTSAAEEIRSAYRKIALRHHPDRSTDPTSPAIFMTATEAYEVLSDPQRRREYDARLDLEARKRAAAAAQPKAKPRPQPRPQPKAPSAPRPGPPPPKVVAPPKGPSVAEELARLSSLFTKGRQAEAERLARRIIERDPRQPVPYAVLGDILRARGDADGAAKMYAYAAQMDPRNPLYQRRYEDLLMRHRIATDARRTRLEADEQHFTAPAAGLGMVAVGGACLAYVPQETFGPRLGPVAGWSLMLLLVLFLQGVAMGTSLSLGNLLDRFGAMATNSLGRAGPTVALATVAVVSFPAAAALFLATSIAQRSFDRSTAWIVGGVAAATLIAGASAGLSSNLHAGQVLLWGGNLVYLGSLCGWMVSDAFRRPY